MGLSLKLILAQSHSFPSGIPILEVADSELENMLKEALEQVKIHKNQNPKERGSNYFNTNEFVYLCKKFSTKFESKPAYTAGFNGNGLELQSLRDFSGVERILTLFKSPQEERKTPEENFSKKFKETLDWKVNLQEKIVKYVLEYQQTAIKSKNAKELKDLSRNDISVQFEIHESTVSRLIRGLKINLYEVELPIGELILNKKTGLIRANIECFLSDLVKRYQVENVSELKLSDNEIRNMYLNENPGIEASRRLINVVRNSMASNEKSYLQKLFSS